MTDDDQPRDGTSQIPGLWYAASPPGGQPSDSPTEQLPLGEASGFGEPAGAGGAMPPVGPPNWVEHQCEDRRRALHWMVGIVVACLLAGGVIAALSLNHHQSGTSGNAAPAGPAGGAAVLSAALNAAGGPGASPSASRGDTRQSGVCAKARQAARDARLIVIGPP
jgi:hypothetical protein